MYALKFAVAFLLLFAKGSQAQHWAPFNLNERFNYRNDTAYVISANYFVDSVEVVGTDSVFYLNRVRKDVQASGDSLFVYLDEPQSWGNAMMKHTNGDYGFSNHTMLRVNAALNESWLFDTLDNVNALVEMVYEDSLFGELDSVKVISLSNGDSVLISKNHGLISFPEGNGSPYQLTLTGIDGRNVGELMPNFWTVFNFEVGDTFCYAYGSGVAFPIPWGTTSKFLYVVEGKQIFNDTIYYTFKMFHHTQDYYNYQLVGSSQGGGGSQTMPCVRNVSSLLERGHCASNWRFSVDTGELNLGQYHVHEYSSTVAGWVRLDTSTYGRRTIFLANAMDTAASPSQSNPYFVYSFYNDYELRYAERLGLVNKSSWEFEQGTTFKLTGCVVGGQRYGIVYAPELFDGVESLTEDITMFPNPFNSVLTISASHSQRYDLTVYDLVERVVIRTKLIGLQQLDLSGLESQSYIVELSNDTTRHRQLIVKQ